MDRVGEVERAAVRDVPFQDAALGGVLAERDEVEELEVAAVDDLDVASARGAAGVFEREGRIASGAARVKRGEERRD